MSETLRDQLALLPRYLGNHVLLVVAAMAAAVVLSVPLGIYVFRRRVPRVLALGTTSVILTIPGLALLAGMVVVLGIFGFMPAFIALLLYGMLPILRNTVTGLDGVDPNVVEAARGMGMTPMQTLTKVRLPLALPIIIAGIRTATVWTVGLATLATPVGANSLGNYIFFGLHIFNFEVILLGCVASAVLALVLDGVIRALEVAAQRRSRALALFGGGALAIIVAAALAPLALQAYSDAQDTSGRGTVVVGAKTFTEQYILAELMGRRLEAAGYRVEKRESLGSIVVFDALANNEIDCFVDYSGTIWANLMNRTDNPGAESVLQELTDHLEAEYGIRNLGPLGFENAYAVAVREKDAADLGLKTVADLAPHAPEMTIGSDSEFFGRPEWRRLRDAYNLDFREQKSLEPAVMYSAIDQGAVDAITAYTTDGRIIAFDLRLLDDPKDALPPYDAVLLLSPEAAQDPALIAALEPLIAAIGNAAMRAANNIVDVQRKSVGEAVEYLEETLSE